MKNEKWDVIEFSDIQKGDLLELSKTSDRGSVVVKSVVEYWSSGQWRLKNGYAVIDRDPMAGETVEIKRKRPEYVFPKGLGAVIKAKQRATGNTRWFVLIVGQWMDTSTFMTYAGPGLLTHYVDFETLSEGVDLTD